MRIAFYCLICLLAISACKVRKFPAESFNRTAAPPAPDYTQPWAWAAHPAKADSADRAPAGVAPEAQAAAEVDVFFIHPTTFFDEKKGWNASLSDSTLNAFTERRPIRHQASVFNQSCRVFAPRYRQMLYNGFYAEDTDSEKQALDLAYEDVKAAFLHFLEQENRGRPFILASHSQGSLHALRLIRELIDGQELSRQFVAGYIAGWPFRADVFVHIPVCESPLQTGCVMGWCSWKRGSKPKGLKDYYKDAVVVNPVNWSAGGQRSTRTAHRGLLMPDFATLLPRRLDAQAYKGILWVRAAFLPIPKRNYHIGDYNLFWADIRHNVQQRVGAFLSKQP